MATKPTYGQPTSANGLTYNLAELWTEHYPRFRQSRERVVQCGRFRRGEIQPYVPPDMDNADAFRMMVPHATMLGQDVIQFLTRKAPDVTRTSGPGPVAERLASKVEHYLGASGKGGVLGELRANGEAVWEALIAHGTNDGEYGVLVIPRPAHWSSLLDFTEPDPQDPNTSVVRPYFRRDAQGRDPEDAFYSDALAPTFTQDEQKTADAYYEYKRDAQARRLPFVVSILSADSCLPIGVDPATGRVDALLVRTVRTARSLSRDGFRWVMLGPGDVPNDGAAASAPTSILKGGAAAPLLLYELWIPGAVYYCVGNAPAEGKAPVAYDTKLGDAEAWINLEELFSLTSVPGGYFYGAHHASERDPDKKGIPLLWPLLGLIRGVNQTISSIGAHAYNVGFGGWMADPTGADPALWTEQGQPRTIKIQPGKVTYVVGKPTPAAHPGVDKDVSWLVQMGLSLLDRFSPNGAITGNGSAAQQGNGFAQAVGQAAVENSVNQILSGASAAYKRIAECVLEQTACLSELLKEPIPVYTRVDAKGKKHDLLTLSAKDLDGDFSVDVQFPQRKGANIPLAQALFQWWTSGGVSHRTFLTDGWGEEFPEEEEDRIRVEKALNSDRGQQLLWETAARIQGDREMAKIAKLAQQGKMLPGGTPSALVPPRPGQGAAASDGGPAPGQAGVEMGNPAISALGGMMNGVMQTGAQGRVMAATGSGVPTVQPGG